MGIPSSTPPCLLFLILPLLLCFGHNSSSSIRAITQRHNLVYKHCPNNSSNNNITLTDPNDQSLPQIISSLFQELISQSSNLKFYQTSLGDDRLAVSGLFQCREDLSKDDCQGCLRALHESSKTLCGNNTVPARVHLSGCYMHYEADGHYETSSRIELQHKKCGEDKAVFGGFRELMEGAFGELEKCVMKGNGFCDMGFKSLIHVVGQCEGNLEGCDCGACVSGALEIAMDECGDSISGEVYLDSCFISYEYFGDRRVPTIGQEGTQVYLDCLILH